MRSITSLYVGVYIWIASLEIRTKILIKILNNSYSPAKVLLFLDIRKFMKLLVSSLRIPVTNFCSSTYANGMR